LIDVGAGIHWNLH